MSLQVSFSHGSAILDVTSGGNMTVSVLHSSNDFVTLPSSNYRMLVWTGLLLCHKIPYMLSLDISAFYISIILLFFFLISKDNFINKETPKKWLKVYKPIHPPLERLKKERDPKPTGLKNYITILLL